MTNYTGYYVVLNLDELCGPDSGGTVAIPVREIPGRHSSENYGCDFCAGPRAARYVVDAEAVLGADAGHNTFYCQKCAETEAQHDPRRAGEATWISPEIAAALQK